MVAMQSAFAQTYPGRSLRIIVPFAAGGGVDNIARIVGQRLGEQLGQPVVVDNRPGGNANIGLEMAAKARPDGYTLLMASSIITVNRALMANLPFDPLKDFTPVARVGYSPSILVCLPSFPAKSVKDLVAMAKAQPGKLTFASTGTGSGQHLAGEMLKLHANVDIVHVPYKGGSQGINDLLGGHVSFMFTVPSEVLPHISANRLKALAVTSKARASFLPEVPGVFESGYDFEHIAWWGLVVPAGVPKEIVDKLNVETNKVLALPVVKESLNRMGVEVSAATPEQFKEFFDNRAESDARLIATLKLRVE